MTLEGCGATPGIGEAFGVSFPRTSAFHSSTPGISLLMTFIKA